LQNQAWQQLQTARALRPLGRLTADLEAALAEAAPGHRLISSKLIYHTN
jgi:hypothetical protein